MSDFLPTESYPYFTARPASMEHDPAPKDAGADAAKTNGHTAQHHDHHYKRRLNEALAHFARAFSLSYYGEPHASDVEPRVDLIENKESFIAFVELPGLRPEDIHVEVDDQLFAVSFEGTLHRQGAAAQPSSVAVEHKHAEGDVPGKAAAQKAEAGVDAPRLHIAERSTGHFRRVLQLPAGFVQMDGVKAVMADGLLTITAPKKTPAAVPEAKKARKVEVAKESDAHT